MPWYIPAEEVGSGTGVRGRGFVRDGIPPGEKSPPKKNQKRPPANGPDGPVAWPLFLTAGPVSMGTLISNMKNQLAAGPGRTKARWTPQERQRRNIGHPQRCLGMPPPAIW